MFCCSDFSLLKYVSDSRCTVFLFGKLKFLCFIPKSLIFYLIPKVKLTIYLTLTNNSVSFPQINNSVMAIQIKINIIKCILLPFYLILILIGKYVFSIEINFSKSFSHFLSSFIWLLCSLAFAILLAKIVRY
jgi:hypothetical protein